MKIIAAERPWNQWPETAEEALESSDAPHPSCLHTTLATDSATVRLGMPMFIPDFATGWMLEFVPAVIIKRLGKWIEPRFASRYYTDATVVARLLPSGGEAPCGAFAVNFDGAMAPGKHMPVPADGSFTICVDGADEMTFAPQELHIDDTVALASRFMMLKTGDIILPCRTPLHVAPVVGSRVSVSLNGETALDLKIR